MEFNERIVLFSVVQNIKSKNVLFHFRTWSSTGVFHEAQRHPDGALQAECHAEFNFFFSKKCFCLISEHGVRRAYFNEAQRHLDGTLQAECHAELPDAVRPDGYSGLLLGPAAARERLPADHAEYVHEETG